MQAYFLLTCEPGNEKEIISQIKNMPEVVEINGIWGKYDIIAKATFEDQSGLHRIVKKLRSIKNITCTDTMPVLYGQGGTIDDKMH